MPQPMSFGETQLKKFGWKEGKGLGCKENGISNAIKPKLKFDTVGFGCNKSEEFTFHWWDHVYNKNAKNLSITKNERGEVRIDKEEEIKISTKKPLAKTKEKSCYGFFVKGSVLEGSKEIPESDVSVQNKGSEESQELIKSFSDEQLFKLCGGLTAHKGARHGFTMSAKLARLEQQEKAFVRDECNNSEDKLKTALKESKKRSKTKKRKVADCHEVISNEVLSKSTDISISPNTVSESGIASKKKKKSKYKEVSECDNFKMDSDSVVEEPREKGVTVNNHSSDENELLSKQKKKKKKKRRRDDS